jgi:hypothetical protein
LPARRRAGSWGFGTGTGSVVDAGALEPVLSGTALGSDAAFAGAGLCGAPADGGDAALLGASPCGARTGGALVRAAEGTTLVGVGGGALGAAFG